MKKFFLGIMAIFFCIEFVFGQNLIEPKEDTDTFPLKKNILRVIVFSSNEIWCYTNNVEGKKLYSIGDSNTFHHLIEQQKDLYKDSLLIIIKPTSKATSRDVVEILDQLTIDSINRFAIFDLTDKEMGTFEAKSFVLSPPAPVEITLPRSVSSETSLEPDSNEVILSFEFYKAGTVSYLIKTQFDSIKANVPLNQAKVESVIANAQMVAQKQNKILTVLIKGDNNAEYPVFKTLIGALIERKVYKYKLITTPPDK